MSYSILPHNILHNPEIATESFVHFNTVFTQTIIISLCSWMSSQLRLQTDLKELSTSPPEGTFEVCTCTCTHTLMHLRTHARTYTCTLTLYAMYNARTCTTHAQRTHMHNAVLMCTHAHAWTQLDEWWHTSPPEGRTHARERTCKLAQSRTQQHRLLSEPGGWQHVSESSATFLLSCLFSTLTTTIAATCGMRQSLGPRTLRGKVSDFLALGDWGPLQ